MVYKKSKKFMETFRSGKPYGVVLLFEKPDEKKFVIVDGLQIISTLKHYCKNINCYVGDIINEDILKKLYDDFA